MGVSNHVAFDLGAESGRAVVGRLSDGRLDVAEVARFPNRIVNLAGRLHWNAFQLFEEMKAGLSACKVQPDSIGVDTWGVDFALLDRNGEVIGLPYSYRDPRNLTALESFVKKMPRERVHRLTGLQVLFVNSVYQLEGLVQDRSPWLEIAQDLLFMPDLFHYLFTGVKATEYTFATTSQLYNPAQRIWDPEIFETLGLSTSLMQDIVMPGTVLGTISDSIARETGAGPAPLVAVASHDTGSAVAAVPAQGDDWAFISSGTWSIVGVLADRPVINALTLKGNFSNEGSSSGGYRLLKNINALWLVQQCRRAWLPDGVLSYDDLTRLAAEAEPFAALVDPDSLDFASPPDMPEAIRTYCRRTGQKAPESRGAVVRCALESIALKYRTVLEVLGELRGKPVTRAHVMGGGTQNKLLCQFAANATGLPVLAGPLEATAIGNILVQAKALGYLSSDDEIRQVVRDSFEVVRYEPAEGERWGRAYDRFREIEGR